MDLSGFSESEIFSAKRLDVAVTGCYFRAGCTSCCPDNIFSAERVSLYTGWHRSRLVLNCSFEDT